MKKILYSLLVLSLFLFISCGGGASSSGPDGGVSGLGYYDFFNGHTWSLTTGSSAKTSFIFANAKVTRKEFAYESGAWVEKYASTEKKYVLKDWTENGQHGTIVTEDMFSNNPAQYSFLNEKVVVLSYNNQAFTFTRED